jgi:hypothetical protein
MHRTTLTCTPRLHCTSQKSSLNLVNSANTKIVYNTARSLPSFPRSATDEEAPQRGTLGLQALSSQRNIRVCLNTPPMHTHTHTSLSLHVVWALCTAQCFRPHPEPELRLPAHEDCYSQPEVRWEIQSAATFDLWSCSLHATLEYSHCLYNLSPASQTGYL